MNFQALTYCDQIIQQAKVAMKRAHAAAHCKGGTPHVPYKHLSLRLFSEDRKVSHSSDSVLKSMEQAWLTPAN